MTKGSREWGNQVWQDGVMIMRRSAPQVLSIVLAGGQAHQVVPLEARELLHRLGVATTSVVAIFGAAGLAVGLALQGTLSNFAAGVMLLIFRPFKVGDIIEAGGGPTGKVESIGLFSTSLNTPDNIHIVVPNSAMCAWAISA